ncbi:hypothetical protein AB0F43_04240 [Kribbella sp. NPDC023972]|uniref:hypothetical protein n=1 Tax=Kribbella sp. NPDC023972 TaxID=3154795 RepID=UPI0033D9ECC1
MLTALIATTGLLVGLPTAVVTPGVPTPSPAGPDCERNRLTGQCRIAVTGESTSSTEKTGRTPGAAGGGQSGCVFEGQAIPCRTENGFWDAASGCYLTPTDSLVSLVHSASDYPPGTKFYRCWVVLGVVDGRPEGIERFEPVIREPGEPATIDPRVAAQRVVETMTFRAPQLGLSPHVQSASGDGIVNVPVWMWVTDPGANTTGPLTKQATLGGVTIVATGTVDRIEWSMGPGAVVTCKGAGTPFTRANAEGKSLKEIPPSPTCGHKYLKTSRCEKDGKFQVTATAHWNVHWTGGGMQGDIPLSFSRSIPLRITDLRPVLVASEGPATAPPHSTRPCS